VAERLVVANEDSTQRKSGSSDPQIVVAADDALGLQACARAAVNIAGSARDGFDGQRGENCPPPGWGRVGVGVVRRT
jgi:hypothetical protein